MTLTDQESYCGALPSSAKSGQEVILNSGDGKVSFIKETPSPFPTIHLRKICISKNLVFLFTKTILFTNNY